MADSAKGECAGLLGCIKSDVKAIGALGPRMVCSCDGDSCGCFLHVGKQGSAA